MRAKPERRETTATQLAQAASLARVQRSAALVVDVHQQLWRWRESNPRPKMPRVGVYKLRLVLWFRNGPSHEQDGLNLASEGFGTFGGSDRARYTRLSRRLNEACGRLHKTAFPSLEKELRMQEFSYSRLLFGPPD